MNQEKYLKKIEKRYGTKDIKDLSLAKIKNLKLNEKKLRQEKQKFKLIRKPINTIVKGATIGASVAGVVNTAFPNIVPTVGGYITALSNQGITHDIFSLSLLSSKPIDLISGYGIIGLGAAAGAVLYTGFKLLKTGFNNAQIINDRHKNKKLQK